MKIVLAIDLSESDLIKNPNIYEELTHWCQDVKTDVLPVYVTSSTSENNFRLDKTPAFHLLQLFADLTVLKIPGGGRKKEIEALLEFAKKQNADIIALISQGKSSIEKKVLGSFAEGLLVRAEIPLLFLDDEIQRRTKTDTVLFATDFSDISNDVFNYFLDFMSDQKPEIVLFHAIALPQFAATGIVYSQALQLLPQNYWDEQKEWAHQKAAALIRIAESRGFRIRLEIVNQVLSVETAIHEAARKEKVRLVALTSVSNPLERFLLGSVSYSVLRAKIKPLWICGPQCWSHSAK